MDIPTIRLLGVDRNIKKHPPPKRKLHVSVQTLRERLGSAGGEEGYQGTRGVDADITGLGSETGERGERDAEEAGRGAVVDRPERRHRVRCAGDVESWLRLNQADHPKTGNSATHNPHAMKT
jgi:hypothetical protein